jgi:hypothetical protein
MEDGRATVKVSGTIDVVVDGPCLLGTLEKLREGFGAKPMPDAALTKVRADAVRLLEAVVESYEERVAAGEVGATGSARASSAQPIGGCPTGLLYGRVQSGKTVAMITFCAAAIDNGFRVVVVLTSDFVKLVEQTADRFGALDGPLIRNALQSESWFADAEHVKKHVGKHGVVFICTKNQNRLGALVDFLNEIGAANYPALVLDDEADQATLDTTTQARSSGRKNAPKQASAIHRKTVSDDEGQSIRQTLRHHVFVQVTATPYALLLQNVDNPLRPSFTRLLEPGDGYSGGEKFFDVNHVENGDPPLVFVHEDESAQIDAGEGSDPPLGLQQAIAFFLISAAAQNVLDPASRSIGQNFLCHTSQKQTEHTSAADLIRAYVSKISDDLDRGVEGSETMMRLHSGLEELRRTIDSPPPLEDLVDRIKRRLPRRDVPIVNSANSRVDFGRELNFIVGGNILGRGLTIDNLLVTYYLRRAKISQMDTVLQHARMYGYREVLMPFARVFLPEDLAARFHFIHEAERTLRAQLKASGGQSGVTVETMTKLRATRLNVLDTNTLTAYESGGHIYPGGPDLTAKALNKSSGIEAAVKQAVGGTLIPRKFVEVDNDVVISLLRQLPFNEDIANRWDPENLEKVLRHLAARYENRAFLYYRTMDRTKPHFSTGALDGAEELPKVRSQGAPVLCVFRDSGQKMLERTGGREFWYPTLVFPHDMPTQVFNTSG